MKLGNFLKIIGIALWFFGGFVMYNADPNFFNFQMSVNISNEEIFISATAASLGAVLFIIGLERGVR